MKKKPHLHRRRSRRCDACGRQLGASGGKPFGSLVFCSLSCFRHWELGDECSIPVEPEYVPEPVADVPTEREADPPVPAGVEEIRPVERAGGDAFRIFRPILGGITALLALFLTGMILVPAARPSRPAATPVQPVIPDRVVPMASRPAAPPTREDVPAPTATLPSKGSASAETTAPAPPRPVFASAPQPARATTPAPEPLSKPEVNTSPPLSQPMTPPTPAVAGASPVRVFPVHSRGMVAEDPYHIMRGAFSLPLISLTFDGSAYNDYVEHVLQVLDEEQVHATFFLSGEFLHHYPAEARAIAAAGHEVGNHLYEHVHLTTWEENHRHDRRPGITRELVQSLLRRNEELYHRVTGRQMSRLWRAPYGETNAEIDGWAAELGYIQVAWTRDYARGESMDALDWVWRPEESRYLTAPRMLERLLNFDAEAPDGANGSIILMHLGSLRTRDHSWTILPELIRRLRRKGYSLVPVSRLISETLSRVYSPDNSSPTAESRTTADKPAIGD